MESCLWFGNTLTALTVKEDGLFTKVMLFLFFFRLYFLTALAFFGTDSSRERNVGTQELKQGLKSQGTDRYFSKPFDHLINLIFFLLLKF